jgi:hypothetical protein
VFEFFIRVEEFDGHKSVGLLDGDGSALIQTLDFVDNCIVNDCRE